MAAQTMFDKIWGRHVVAVEGACICLAGCLEGNYQVIGQEAGIEYTGTRRIWP